MIVFTFSSTVLDICVAFRLNYKQYREFSDVADGVDDECFKTKMS